MNISPKYKAFIVRFVVLIVLLFVLMLLFKHYIITDDDNLLQVIIPAFLALILAPRVHIANEQSGTRYGLKSVFTKKIIWFDE
ncbi:MAG: hypothetical protein WBA16_00975 [Nonlabens sp.]